MDWKGFWDQQARSSENPHIQVSRTSKKVAVDTALMERIADHIADRLDLQPTDRLLDVCCGNGMLTALLAKRCKEVVGVDLSEELIRLAVQHHSAKNVRFVRGDATRLREVISGPFDKINLYFSFQYMDTYRKGKNAIGEMLALLSQSSGSQIFLGDVPDFAHLDVYYPSFSQRIKYHLNLLLGRSLMGKFWKEQEISRIVGASGAVHLRMMQPPDLPYSHYRVDYLLVKSEEVTSGK